MERRLQNGFYLHYSEGVYNIARTRNEFYAENIKSSYKVPCVYCEVKED